MPNTRMWTTNQVIGLKCDSKMLFFNTGNYSLRRNSLRQKHKVDQK